MIRLNPVTENDDSVKRGLYTDDTYVPSNLKCKTFKEILTTDATMEDGESKVAKYFGVQRQWNKLNEEWSEKTRRNQRLQAVLRTFISRQIRKYEGSCMV